MFIQGTKKKPGTFSRVPGFVLNFVIGEFISCSVSFKSGRGTGKFFRMGHGPHPAPRVNNKMKSGQFDLSGLGMGYMHGISAL